MSFQKRNRTKGDGLKNQLNAILSLFLNDLLLIEGMKYTNTGLIVCLIVFTSLTEQFLADQIFPRDQGCMLLFFFFLK